MGRSKKDQKAIEKQLITEVLQILGYEVSKAKWQEQPDAVLTVCKSGVQKILGVEHTSYFNDTSAGVRSPRTPVAEFWNEVQKSLMRRICKRPDLTGILLTVQLRQQALPAKPAKGRQQELLARSLAKELVEFMLAHPSKVKQWYFYNRHTFATLPTMSQIVESVRIHRWTNDVVYASHGAWDCGNVTTGHIGLSPDYLVSAIKNKDGKAANYSFPLNSKKWLLIAADSLTPSSAVGPADAQNWSNPNLLATCEKSVFDRILFWERTRCWYKWLKPFCPVCQYREPYIQYGDESVS